MGLPRIGRNVAVGTRTRIIVIAPTTKGLPELQGLPKEVMGFVNAKEGDRHYQVKLLQGEVTEQDVAQAAIEGRAEIWWIASHGGPDGIALSNSTLTIASLAPYVRTSMADLLVLNSCESLEIAAQLQQECNCDVVATVGEIDDRVASRTAGVFATNLLRHGDPRKAYELSKPGANKDYVYLTRYEGNVMAPPIQAEAWSNPSGVKGSSNDPGEVLLRLVQLETKLGYLEADIKEIKEAVKPGRNGSFSPASWWMLMAGIVTLAVMALLLYMVGKT
jgi:hypothetical protein